MSIDRDGFLSDEVLGAIPRIRGRHQRWFDFANKINLLAQRVFMRCIPKWQENDPDGNVFRRQLVAGPLVARCVSGFQGTLLLSERGMVIEARCLTRMILEATFVLAAVHNDSSFLNDYVADDLSQRRKLIEKFRKVSTISELTPDVVESMEAEWAKVIAEIAVSGAKLKPLTTAEIASRGGMSGHYLSMYALLSQTVHSVARDLNRHYIATADGEIEDLQWAPGIEEIHEVIASACDVVFMNMSRAMPLFRIDELPDEKKRFDDLWAEWVAMREEAVGIE